MTLPNKISTRLTALGNAILDKIDSKISTHNSSNSAHSDIRNGYVANADNYKHSHGYITQSGEITQTTSSPTRVLVTENNKIKSISVLPASKVTHQDLSGKVDVNQGQNNSGKFLKVQASGSVEPEEVNIPSLNINQTKNSGEEIATINNIKLYCNQDTTYNNATTSNAGLMSSADKTKLDSVQSGSKNVSFSRVLNSGVKIGTLTIGNDSQDLFCVSQTAAYDNATTSRAGLMSSEDKTKLNGIQANAKNVSFSRTVNSGTKIGAITIGNTSTDIYSPNTVATGSTAGLMSGADKTKLDSIQSNAKNVSYNGSYVAGTKIGTLTIGNSSSSIYTPDYGPGPGIRIQNREIGHSNSVTARTESALCKMKYDAQGHITEATTVDIDTTNGGTFNSSSLITSGAVFGALQNKKDVLNISQVSLEPVQSSSNNFITLTKYDKIVVCDIRLDSWETTNVNAGSSVGITSNIPNGFKSSSLYTTQIFQTCIDPSSSTVKTCVIFYETGFNSSTSTPQLRILCRTSGTMNVRGQLIWITD